MGDQKRQRLQRNPAVSRDGSAQATTGAPGNIINLRTAQRARSQIPLEPDPALNAHDPRPPIEEIARPSAGTAEPAIEEAGVARPMAGAPFWDIWLEHREHLRRQSLRLMAGNRADAEDALSAAMLKACQKFSLYADEIINERAWLTRLLHNACMDLYRSQKRQARWNGDLIGEIGETPIAAQPEPERTPEEIALGRETIGQVALQLERLPPNLRLPFVMRFIQNRSYTEIAAQLELSNCAVRKRIQLARDRLKRNIDR